jgi:hypothetical protein
MVSGGVAWIQFNGPPEFLRGGIEIPIEAIQAKCKGVVSFGDCWDGHLKERK